MLMLALVAAPLSSPSCKHRENMHNQALHWERIQAVYWERIAQPALQSKHHASASFRDGASEW